jgi:hypothetical protein
LSILVPDRSSGPLSDAWRFCDGYLGLGIRPLVETPPWWDERRLVGLPPGDTTGPQDRR